MFAKYIGGIIGLTKDALRIAFYFLKRPHYVAVVLLLIVGAFYVNGVPPWEISGFLSGKWQALVENRKQTFKEDMRLISAHFDQEKNETPAKEDKTDEDDRAAEIMQNYQRQMEEEVSWKKAFEEAQNEKTFSGENVVEGTLSVVSSSEVRVAGQTFSLKVRLHSGKAGEAYQQIKRRFEGRQAKCVPDNDNPEKAECYVGALGVSEMLVDFNLADPI